MKKKEKPPATKSKPAVPSEAKELPVLFFSSGEDWRKWLHAHHESSKGVWIKFAKKNSGIASLSYPHAVEGALCYGWIDGQTARFDDSYWLQRFTPRSPKSIWSKINRERVNTLIEKGEMQPAGLEAVRQAKENGEWDAAYDSPSQAIVPEDLEAALRRSKKAKTFFESLSKSSRFAILFRIQTAKKPETRAKRIQQFVDMLQRGEKLH
jgi:uncharacterized protein YdeI (YjbR/CyaY-like superfamily)